MEIDNYGKNDLERSNEADERLEDHNAELSETKSGFLYRSSAATHGREPEVRAKKARKTEAELAQLSALQQRLTDPNYAEAYTQAKDTIADFKEHMTERLEQIDQQIDALDKKLEDYAPGSPEHKRIMREREDLQRRQQELLDYYNDIIRPIEERMDDPDNPPTKEELDEFNDKARRDMDDVLSREQKAHVTPDPRPIETADTVVPDLSNLPS